MGFFYKKFSREGGNMLAISDSSILGKTFEEGELQITVSKEFYGESRCSETEAVGMIKESSIVNAVGKDIISLMLKEKLVDDSRILTIKGIPHVQIITL